MSNNNETEGDLHGSGNIPVGFEIIERNKVAEAVNYAYANSFRGRLGNFIDRHSFQLWQRFCRFVNVLKWSIVKIATLSIKGIYFSVLFIYNEYCYKTNHERINTVKAKDNTKSTENNTKSNAKSIWNPDWKKLGRGIMGIATLFVVVSIAHSAWVITQGTDDKVSLIMAAPMVIWAAIQLIKQFTKQGAK